MYIMLTGLDASRIRVDPAHHRSDDWEFGAMWRLDLEKDWRKFRQQRDPEDRMK
jgi:hypothetical protein